MLQKLRSNGLTADKETVRLILKSLDPAAVDIRKGRKLTRREYHSFGPNHAWHIDGCDKLKPFGIAIHGVIDGYNPIILCLKLSSSNNPKVIANYYVCCIKELNLIPHVVRGDRGNENVTVCGIQRFLRRHRTDSHIKDKFYLWSLNSKPMYRILVVSVIQNYNVLVDYLYDWWIASTMFMFLFFLVHYNMSLTRLNLFGIVIAFIIIEIQTAQVVVQMYLISRPKVQE